jgi:hypothetical protein
MVKTMGLMDAFQLNMVDKFQQAYSSPSGTKYE